MDAGTQLTIRIITLEYLNRKIDMQPLNGLKLVVGAAMLPLPLLVFLVSCSGPVDSMITIELRATVYAANGDPMPGVGVWLKDRAFDDRKQPSRLQRIICTTSVNGQCSASIEYRYGRSVNPLLGVRDRAWYYSDPSNYGVYHAKIVVFSEDLLVSRKVSYLMSD